MMKKKAISPEKHRGVFVVDDDPDILDAFEAMLEANDYDVTTFSDADFLLSPKLEKKDLPDIILLDVLLSGQDGREVCKELKNRKITKNVPVIIVSAHPDVKDTYKNAGAEDFLSKPFEMDELIEKIEKLTN
ncbi:MAG: response regulator [Candidatus Curtissbacteria bacterium]|nr:response regulator [Candidatus Curtissbacteria bacterium]